MAKLLRTCLYCCKQFEGSYAERACGEHKKALTRYEARERNEFKRLGIRLIRGKI